jgi:hypothetical protein
MMGGTPTTVVGERFNATILEQHCSVPQARLLAEGLEKVRLRVQYLVPIGFPELFFLERNP